MKKSSTHCYMTQEEKESLREVAWQNRMTISQFIRYALKMQGVEIEEE